MRRLPTPEQFARREDRMKAETAGSRRVAQGGSFHVADPDGQLIRRLDEIDDGDGIPVGPEIEARIAQFGLRERLPAHAPAECHGAPCRRATGQLNHAHCRPCATSYAAWLAEHPWAGPEDQQAAHQDEPPVEVAPEEPARPVLAEEPPKQRRQKRREPRRLDHAKALAAAFRGRSVAAPEVLVERFVRQVGEVVDARVGVMVAAVVRELRS